MTDLMNNSSSHYSAHPGEISGNRRPARPSSAQQRSTTPTPPNRQQSTGLNTTAKLEQSILKQEMNRTTTSTGSQKLNGKGKNRLYSTWTPLQDEETNARLFDERKQLVNKWFDKWTDEQRRIALEELMSQCRPRQLTHTRNLLTKKFPALHQDFTRVFPRVISLYIFSFLDPRSLCRCAQVCWYWKFLSETDQLWMPKCLRFGWTPRHNPSPYDSNVWRRVYSDNIQTLQTMPIRISVITPSLTVCDREVQTDRQGIEYSHRSHLDHGGGDQQLSSRQNSTRSVSSRHQLNQSHLSATNRSRMEQPPWRANSRRPTDTLRYNYLDNDDMTLDSLMGKHRKATQQVESDHETRNTSKERQARGRTNDQHERSSSAGRKRRSQSLSARGSPSVSFRDEHTYHQHHSFLARPPSATGVNRPVDMPRPPSSAQKLRYASKASANENANRTWHATNNDDYVDE